MKLNCIKVQKKRRINSLYHGFYPIIISILICQILRMCGVKNKYLKKKIIYKKQKKLSNLIKLLKQLKPYMQSQHTLRLLCIDGYQIYFPAELKNSQKAGIVWNKYKNYDRMTQKDPNRMKNQKDQIRKLLELIFISSGVDMQALVLFNSKAKIPNEKMTAFTAKFKTYLQQLIANNPLIPESKEKKSEMIEVQSQMIIQMGQPYFYPEKEVSNDLQLGFQNQQENQIRPNGREARQARLQTFRNLRGLNQLTNSRLSESDEQYLENSFNESIINENSLTNQRRYNQLSLDNSNLKDSQLFISNNQFQQWENEPLINLDYEREQEEEDEDPFWQ